MADAILNSKLNVAEKMNIKLNVKANVPDKLPMSDVELCSMLGNILDNAVEACGTLPDPSRRRYHSQDIKSVRHENSRSVCDADRSDRHLS